MEMHPLSSIMQTTMENIKQMVDVNTIVGTPITAPDGTMIVPVSKVSFGFASGGSDFDGKTAPKTNFGGGGGAGVTINPIAFLVVSSEGVRLIPVSSSSEPGDKVAALVPEMFDKIVSLFKSKEKDKSKKDEKSDCCE